MSRIPKGSWICNLCEKKSQKPLREQPITVFRIRRAIKALGGTATALEISEWINKQHPPKHETELKIMIYRVNAILSSKSYVDLFEKIPRKVNGQKKASHWKVKKEFTEEDKLMEEMLNLELAEKGDVSEENFEEWVDFEEDEADGELSSESEEEKKKRTRRRNNPRLRRRDSKEEENEKMKREDEFDKLDEEEKENNENEEEKKEPSDNEKTADLSDDLRKKKKKPPRPDNQLILDIVRAIIALGRSVTGLEVCNWITHNLGYEHTELLLAQIQSILFKTCPNLFMKSKSIKGEKSFWTFLVSTSSVRTFIQKLVEEGEMDTPEMKIFEQEWLKKQDEKAKSQSKASPQKNIKTQEITPKKQLPKNNNNNTKSNYNNADKWKENSSDQTKEKNAEESEELFSDSSNTSTKKEDTENKPKKSVIKRGISLKELEGLTSWEQMTGKFDPFEELSPRRKEKVQYSSEESQPYRRRRVIIAPEHVSLPKCPACEKLIPETESSHAVTCQTCFHSFHWNCISSKPIPSSLAIWECPECISNNKKVETKRSFNIYDDSGPSYSSRKKAKRQ